jgi:hypothetical protein
MVCSRVNHQVVGVMVVVVVVVVVATLIVKFYVPDMPSI